MKKILLTGGSSFSVGYPDPTLVNEENYVHDKWPRQLAQKCDLKLINRSKPGASNLYIYDHLMENIIKYGNEIELVVAAWTYGFKTSIFRNYELNFVNLDDQDWGNEEFTECAETIKNKILKESLLFSSIEQTLRLMIYLQDTCNSKNIKCIHYPLLNIFKTDLELTSQFKFLERIIHSDNFERINAFDNVIGWPCDTLIGGYTFNTMYQNYTISQSDHHPNEKGHELISEEIYDKYLKMIGSN